jgi:hypothetical protein
MTKSLNESLPDWLIESLQSCKYQDPLVGTLAQRYKKECDDVLLKRSESSSVGHFFDKSDTSVDVEDVLSSLQEELKKSTVDAG